MQIKYIKLEKILQEGKKDITRNYVIKNLQNVIENVLLNQINKK